MKSEPDWLFGLDWGQIYENTSCVFTLRAVAPLVLRSTNAIHALVVN
jgi:hypothetical protein